ncbi:SPOSA6832_02511, partial [Sporobolomyces salmonicolor]
MTAVDLPPNVQPGPVEIANALQAKELLDRYDTILFDEQYIDGNYMYQCDGVIWTGPAGDKLTADISETIVYLRSLNKRIAFITNNATSSRAAYVRKFAGFGIDVHIDEIFTCGSATASFVREVVLPERRAKGQQEGIYLIGQAAMEEELKAEGLQWTGGTDAEDDVLLEPQNFDSIRPNVNIGIVIYAFQMRSSSAFLIPRGFHVSLESMLPPPPSLHLPRRSFRANTASHHSPQVNYKQLAKAYNYLTSNPGCQLILTNDDQSFLLPHGGYAPGEGAISSVLVCALRKGVKPTIVGKPHQPLLDIVHRSLDFTSSRTLFIGDRLDTDVLFAKRGKIDSMLVWTGISKPIDLVGLSSDKEPEWTCESVGRLLDARTVANGATAVKN